MTKKDVLELKRRFKKTECTFTKMCGCYVNADKEIVLNLEETFLNLEDEEFYKYLEIANKTLSGTIGNNLLELEFPLEEEKSGGKQQFLLGLRESKLRNDGLLESFYRLIIDNYDYAGNYLILIFHDAYDVMKKTSDNAKLDESEEVYEYLLCAVCPVTLSKPGLGYLETENRIGPRNRDWIVNPPDTGFVFPAFTDRSTDLHAVMYYTKDAKEPHREFMDCVLGCPVKQTATEQKNTFQTIISNAIMDDDIRDKALMEIQETLNDMIEEQAVYADSKQDPEPIVLTSNSIQTVLASSSIPEEAVTKIETSYNEKFGDTPLVVDHLIDNKLLAANAQRKKETELVEQVQRLTEQLNEVTLSNQNVLSGDDPYGISEDETVDDSTASSAFDVILKVKPQKMDQISSQVIDGKKCIVIPMDENEHANVNGEVDII